MVEKTAKALIDAHRDAIRRKKVAEQAQQQIKYPDRPHIFLYDIGPHCAAYDQKDIDRLSEQHKKSRRLSGMECIEFNARISKCREALRILEALHEQWRKDHRIDDLEEAASGAYSAEKSAFKALLAGLKRPSDQKSIAKYFSNGEGEFNYGYQARVVLKALVLTL